LERRLKRIWPFPVNIFFSTINIWVYSLKTLRAMKIYEIHQLMIQWDMPCLL
jgi:hypothetical protein